MCSLRVFSLILSVYAATAAAWAGGLDNRVKSFMEAYLRRSMTSAEISHVAGITSTDTEQALAALPPLTQILISKDGQAEALSVRHRIIQGAYFAATRPGEFELKLLQEHDRIRVIDPVHKRLMTERDVAAITNIASFGLSQGDPRHKDLPRETIERLVTALDRAYGPHDKAGELPPLFSEAAAFWAGVQHEWPRLTAAEKEFVRKYCRVTWGATPDISATQQLYSRLWGLDSEQAALRSLDDTMRSTRSVSMAAMGVYAKFDMMDLVVEHAGRW
jgi:hypothetical protein